MNIGLVLSGGMSKGAYQIGALRAIEKFIPMHEIKYISCSSVGILNGYAFATNALPKAERMWKRLCANDVRLFVTQLMKGDTLSRTVSALYDPERTLSPDAFYATLLDSSRRNVVYKDLMHVEKEKLPKYLTAGVSIPFCDRGVCVDTGKYYDGSIADNIPIYPLLKHNLDYILCIYFDDASYHMESSYFDNKIIKIVFPGDSIIRQSPFYNQESIELMLKKGYEKTHHILRSVFAEGYLNLDYIYRATEMMNQSNQNRSFRITGDSLVTGVNRIAQKMTKRKII